MAIPVGIKIGMSVAKAAFSFIQTSAAGKAAQEAANARQKMLNHQAAQARQNAGQERAASQRAAINERRKGNLISSRAQAVAAASGGGTGGSVENILGDIGEEGEFRALNELFIGEDRARNLEMQADMKVYEGQEEARAGKVARNMARSRAFTNLASDGVSMYEKYGAQISDTSTSSYDSRTGITWNGPRLK